QALEWFERAETSKQKHFYLGRSLRALGQHDQALSQFDRAASAGWDRFDCTMERIETLMAAERLDEAQRELDAAAAGGSGRAQWHYMRGCLLERQGQPEEAIEAFTRAVELDESYVPARFKLAYALDLRGQDEQAIEQYRQCVARRPAHINALMNLAVICEDLGRYDEAARYLEQVLAADPNHARARLFLKDVQSSKTMFIDEDQERLRERRVAVLDIPISDFELSVRSRNCLKKMNIHTVGDLLRISEPELLAYKNFGETSLSEIKNMLAQKGLRLGQLLEEQQNAARQRALEQVMAQGSPEALDKPVSELELSVRARKCLQRLNIETLGDLASRTEAELLGTKNFGQTSLNEVKQRLAQYGLSLRKISE
ncbi:MAG: tetratricopeptide repeat protein, partial [Phycisphaerae bacterium]